MNFRPLIAAALSLIAMALLGMDYAAKPVRFPSPHGGFEVAFEPPLRNIYRDPDQPAGGPGPKSVRYQIVFYKPGMSAQVAVQDYYDIYASSPTTQADLAKAILWSPGEDFAVLPKENWPAGSSIKGRKLVSLNTSFAWMYATLPLDGKSLVWMDGYRVAGNLKDGCKLSVAQFDAQTGKTLTVMEGGASYGYEIRGESEKKIWMKKVLSPCATPDDARNFKPECATLDLTFLRREIAPCPQ